MPQGVSLPARDGASPPLRAFSLTKFTEQYFAELPQVENGVIRGAKLIGLVSRNKRRYEAKGLEKAISLYEGRKVFVNHPTPESGGERSFGDWVGVIENVQYRKGSGLFGDVVLRQESAHYKPIVEVATSPKFRKSCGFSHVAEGESHFDGDSEIIEGITAVHSVDLVADPATTAGIFESIKPKTFREVVESLPESHDTLRTRLVEMMDAGFMGGDFSMGGGEKEQTTDPLSVVVSILRDAIAAIADMGKAVAKANKPEPALPTAGAVPGKSDPAKSDPANGGDEQSEDEDMSEEDKQKVEAFESLQRENAELKASKLLLESGRLATAIRMKALANCSTDAEQEELLESWPKIEEAGRPSRSAPRLVETESDFPLDNTEKFAALLR